MVEITIAGTITFREKREPGYTSLFNDEKFRNAVDEALAKLPGIFDAIKKAQATPAPAPKPVGQDV